VTISHAPGVWQSLIGCTCMPRIGPIASVSDPLRAGPKAPFVGRVAEARHFSSTLERHVHAGDAGAVGIDLPRRNVINFVAPAGMGKSRLIQRLDSWVVGELVDPGEWGAAPLPPRRVATSRFDFRDPWSVDRLLLMLRSTAAGLGVPLRAFDLGLLARWAISRPGEQFPTAFRSDPRTPVRDIRAEVHAGATEALKEVGLGPAGLSAGLMLELGEYVSRKRNRSGTVASCPYVNPVLSEITRERNDVSATTLALLLHWDLLVARPDHRTPWVCFVDTYELVQDAGRHAEEIVNRLVYYAPEILWVIAGRNALDWATAPSGTLSYRGSQVWPDLSHSSSRPALHRVGPLTDDESRAFLAAALEDLPGRAVVDHACRARIARAAAGLPLYLDLAVETARDLATSRMPIDPEDFGGPLVGMTEAIVRDLPPDERDALRGAALMRTFDAALASVAGGVSHGAGERLCQRSIVGRIDHGLLSNEIHEAVRAAIRATPATLGGWAERDWRTAGERLIDALQRRHTETHTPEDRLALIVTAFDVAADVDLEAPWLLRAALQDQPRTEQAARLIVGRWPDLPTDSWARGFERLVEAWLHEDEARVEILRSVAEDASVSLLIRRSAQRRRAYHLRPLGRHEEVERILAQMRMEPGGDIGLNRYQHALTLITLGRFRQANHLQTLIATSAKDPRSGGWLDRLSGEIRLHHGYLLDALAAIARRADLFNEEGAMKLVIELRAAEARLRALLDPAAIAEAQEVIDLAARYSALGELRSAHCAKALAAAGDADLVQRAVNDAMSVGRRLGRPDVSYHEVLAKAFDAAVRVDTTAFNELDGLIGSLRFGVDPRWARPIAWWRSWTLGQEPPAFHEVEWLEPEHLVRARWIAVATARRARIQTGA
jgi:hypothetical protein